MSRSSRGFVPVQITKKSVNPPAFRRSSTTTSTAFLSSVAPTAPITLLGSFEAVFRRRATFLGALVFAMQAVYRSIQMVFVNVPRHRGRDQFIDRHAARQPLANGRRRDVARVSVNEKNPRLAVAADVFAGDGRHPLAQFRRAL